jgi:hypothetical protein
MALPRSRLASMRAGASAYGTIICEMRDANTGKQQRPPERARLPGRERATRHERSRLSPIGLVNHRPRTEQSPVESRATQSIEVHRVGPVRRFHLWEFNAASPRRTDIEQGSSRHEPTDRLLLHRKRLEAGHEAIDEGDERVRRQRGRRSLSAPRAC